MDVLAAGEPVTPWLAVGGTAGLFAAVGYFLLRLVRVSETSQRTFIDRAEQRIRDLEEENAARERRDDLRIRQRERENRICTRRTGMLIDALRDAGVPISMQVWTKPELDEPPVIE